MKKTLYTIASLYLLIQAALGALSLLSMPENFHILLPLSALSGYGAYWFGQKARAVFLMENAPTAELPVPETNKLDRK